ncbi:hypothetical protein RhiirA1_462473 [Rhizophagus irregularis]|uniref:Uncharacterized protein n=1 Tax=Rhizophagus irregularis TaxID=588596 RepID=A0A2N0RM76_9GLOM|nr:hypothetical protein RhiirA1_462473 [Rhizophagus irregularis]
MEALQDEYDGYIAEFSRNIAFLDDTDNDIVDNINETDDNINENDDNINENDDNINETEEIEDMRAEFVAKLRANLPAIAYGLRDSHKDGHRQCWVLDLSNWFF